EEDACREVSDVGHRRVYVTDRLGMPLIESVTGPEMKTPTEVAEVGEILRRLVRSTGKVRTGIGAGRQDVNVSVTGGTRIEIKGVPRIPRIPLLTYNEAMRQWNLLRLRKELHHRGVTPETFQAKTEDVTRLLRKTRFEPIRRAISEGKLVKCVVLTKFKGLLRWQTQTDTYFSREISDRVRVIACLTTLPNIVHSDSPSETLSTADWQAVKKATGASDEDTVVLVWGDLIDADTGAKEITIRAKEATIGIPSETRQALRDGTNGFERILPGPDRMYPDTDLPPKRIMQERLDQIRKGMPKYYWTHEAWYHTLGIPQDTIRPLAISPFVTLFETAAKEWKLDPVLVAMAFIQYPKRLKRKMLPVNAINVDSMTTILTALRDGKITREGVLPAMELLARNGVVDQFLTAPIPPSQGVQAFIAQIIEDVSKKNIPTREQVVRTAMHLLMKKLRGKVAGAEVENMLQTRLEG
ncbi:MAG: hypothetical protein OEM52_15000, partial [bacterium]|nr:hypothetical protein [bacterium]